MSRYSAAGKLDLPTSRAHRARKSDSEHEREREARELDLFLLLENQSNDVILAQISPDCSWQRRQRCQNKLPFIALHCMLRPFIKYVNFTFKVPMM